LEAYEFTPEDANNLGYDITISYSRKNSLFVTYAGKKTSGRDLITGKYMDGPTEKKNAAVYMNSACVGDRQDYVKELMKYMTVSSLGRCINNDDQNKYYQGCDGLSRYEIKSCVMKNFKFYLAFENTMRDDYVTEKFFGAFYSGSLPVYRGAPNVDEFSPGDHSFINANDFENPKALAEYLQYLAENQTAYDEYFEWRKKPLKQGYVDMLAKGVESVYCRLCDMLSYYDYRSSS